MIKKAGNALIFAVIGLVVVAGLGVGAYHLNKIGILNIGAEKDRVLTVDEAITLMENIVLSQIGENSFHQDSSLKIVVNDNTAGTLGMAGHYVRSLAAVALSQINPIVPSNLDNYSATFEYKGIADIDLRTEDNPKVNYIHSAEFLVDGNGMSFNFSLIVEIVIIDQKIYFRIIELPALLTGMLPEAEAYINTWYVYDYIAYFDKLENEGVLDESIIREIEQDYGISSAQDYRQYISNAFDRQKRIENVKEKMDVFFELFRKHPFFIIERLGKKVQMHDVEVHEYIFNLDIEQLKAFILLSVERINESDDALSVNYGSDISDSQIEELKTILDEVLDYVGEVDIKNWIDEESHALHKQEFVITASIDASGLSDEIIPLRIEYFVEQSKFGKDQEISAPDDAQDILEVIEQYNSILHASYEDQFLLEEEHSLGGDEDEDNLLLSLEEYYCTDPNNPDTDGDGFLDGDEVQGGYNPNGEGALQDYILTLTPEACPDWNDKYGSQ